MIRHGVRLHVVDVRGRLQPSRFPGLRTFRAVLGLAGLLRAHGFDVVHLNLATARLYGRLASLASRRTAVVSTIRGFERRHERWTNWLDDVTVVVSDAVGDFVRGAGVPATRLVTIPNGVDLRAAGKVPVDRTRLHRELGLDPSVKLVGMVAYYRRHDHKGHGNFLEAAARLVPTRPDVHFVSVGSDLVHHGDAQKAFLEHARRLGLGPRLHVLGERNDVVGLMDSFAAHVLPSRSEGCPMAILEAMARGVPNVATRVPGITELIQHGRSGLLVPLNDPPALAAAIERLLDDPEGAAALGAAGRSLADGFSAATMAGRYEVAYHTAIRVRLGNSADALNA